MTISCSQQGAVGQGRNPFFKIGAPYPTDIEFRASDATQKRLVFLIKKVEPLPVLESLFCSDVLPCGSIYDKEKL